MRSVMWAASRLAFVMAACQSQLVRCADALRTKSEICSCSCRTSLAGSYRLPSIAEMNSLAGSGAQGAVSFGPAEEGRQERYAWEYQRARTLKAGRKAGCASSCAEEPVGSRMEEPFRELCGRAGGRSFRRAVQGAVQKSRSESRAEELVGVQKSRSGNRAEEPVVSCVRCCADSRVEEPCGELCEELCGQLCGGAMRAIV
eukprot:352476-Chlamydomonas_euryale.AAC.35